MLAVWYEPSAKVKATKAIEIESSIEDEEENTNESSLLLRSAFVIGAAIAGGALFKRSDAEKDKNNNLIFQYQAAISNIDSEINKLELVLFSKKLSLTIIPKELETIVEKNLKCSEI